MYTVSELVKGQTATIIYVRDGAVWYKVKDFIFPVPFNEIGLTTFLPEYKAIYLMRWIRKYLEKQENV